MSTERAPDWVAICERNARSVQTTIGWIFWDPGAVSRYESLGLIGPLGYIAARCAPLAPAGPAAVIAAFGSISPFGIEVTFELVEHKDRFIDVWNARDEAVLAGLDAYAPDAAIALAGVADKLWGVVDELPLIGRTFFGAHRDMPRPDNAVLSGWHAINCLREWRGDTHWAIVVANGLTHPEASILHNAWLGYERDWLALSRGTDPAVLEQGWRALERKGLAADGVVTAQGLAVREAIELTTNELTTLPWELLGLKDSLAFAEQFEPPCEALLARVDLTAGVNYQPASRQRRARP